VIVLTLCGRAEAAFVIDKSPSRNVTCNNEGAVCSATAPDAVLNVKDLTRLLDAYNVTLESGSASDIELRAPFSWSKPRQLAFTAAGRVLILRQLVMEGQGELSITGKSVSILRPVVVEGVGAVSIAGQLSFRGTGRLDLQNLSATLTINETPYLLANSVATIAQYSYGYVALVADYDASNDGTYAASPISSVNVLEGLGHTISNLSVNDPNTSDNVGLIATTAGEVDDLGLVNVSITGGDQANVGGLAGIMYGGVVHDDYVTGTVQGGDTASEGGLFGASQADGANNTILNSWSSATVSGNYDSRAGGLIGQTYDAFSTIARNCYATGDVSVPADAQTNGDYAGGLIGMSSSTEIIDSYATGSVSTGAGAFAGGLTGYTARSIKRSFATGSVTAGDSSGVGGLTGYMGGGTVEQAYASGNATAGNDSEAGGLMGQQAYGVNVADTYATGAAAAGTDSYVGALAGQITNKLKKSYGTGTVSGGAGSAVGGFVGADYSQGQIDRAYWDTDTTGVRKRSRGAGNLSNDAGIKGLSSATLQARLPRGFSTSIWAQDAQTNDGFPYLRALPPNGNQRGSTPSKVMTK